MKYIFSTIIGLLLLGCSSGKLAENIKCPEIHRNGFSEISSAEYRTIRYRDTLSFTQIRFECTHSALYTQKVMFDRYGKWDREIFPGNRKHPILVWEKIDLLNNGEKFNVLAEGLEEYKHIYASVMVLDLEGNDVLNSSDKAMAISGLFSKMISGNDDQNEAFYETYWNLFDPGHWKRIKGYRQM